MSSTILHADVVRLRIIVSWLSQNVLRSISIKMTIYCSKCIPNIEIKSRPGVVEYTFNPSTQEAEQVDLCEFEATLVYRASSRTARATL